MKNFIAEISKQIARIEGTRFASLTYLTKKSKELARHTVCLGFNYHKLVLKSITELEILMSDDKALPTGSPEKWNTLQRAAADNVMASLRKTIEAHSRGEQNEDYTKKGQYIPIAAGLNLNTSDNTIQLFGLFVSKKVEIEGVYPKVNSSPIVIEQNKIRSKLSISKFREFALDLSNVESVRVNGQTLEFVQTQNPQ